MPSNQIARPVPPECWQKVYKGGPRPKNCKRVMVHVEGEEQSTVAYWVARSDAWHYGGEPLPVTHYLDPGPYQEAATEPDPSAVQRRTQQIIDVAIVVRQDFVGPAALAEWSAAFVRECERRAANWDNHWAETKEQGR